ncbi:hypothetical protein GQ55_6G246300 [Panicum hallii var. hallii]|uniref:Uncharacterized protein n=1 Tax=Panicum hallii var. hallii TaxID=1504633 RepID=A0A2T7D970_9POAL|nr:hypothetical protein GQ55_6G246300 [Panicum hallii var. hallii]
MDEFRCDVPQSLYEHFLFTHFKFYESRLCPLFFIWWQGCIFYGPDFRKKHANTMPLCPQPLSHHPSSYEKQHPKVLITILGQTMNELYDDKGKGANFS